MPTHSMPIPSVCLTLLITLHFLTQGLKQMLIPQDASALVRVRVEERVRRELYTTSLSGGKIVNK